MPDTYTRQSSFSNGDVIDAPLFNAEFDQLVATFHKNTGHSHDGTAAGGSAVPFIQKGNSGVYVDTSIPETPKLLFKLDGSTVLEINSTDIVDSTQVTHTPNGDVEQPLNSYLDGLEIAVGDAATDAASAAESADRAEAAAMVLGVPTILNDGETYTIPEESVVIDVICLGNVTINLPATLTVGYRYSIRLSSKALETDRCTIVNPNFSIIGDIATVAAGDDLELKPGELVILDVISPTELEIL